MQLKCGSMQCMSMHWFYSKLASKSRKNQCIDDQGPHSGLGPREKKGVEKVARKKIAQAKVALMKIAQMKIAHMT